METNLLKNINNSIQDSVGMKKMDTQYLTSTTTTKKDKCN
jgi:hypothetical protein